MIKSQYLEELTTILFEKKKILCVEDHQDTRELLAYFLSDFQMVFTFGIKDSIEKFKKEVFDLCILDNWLVDGSGVDLCRQIRQLTPEIPIIFASGVAHSQEIQKALEAGAEKYLVKPYSLEEMKQIIKELIG